MTSYNARFTLGQKTSYTGEPGLLGDEFEGTAFYRDPATDMLVNINSGHMTLRWVQNLSGSAIVPGTLVAADQANAIDVNVRTAGVNDTPIGIADPFLTSNVANGESFLIVTRANRINALTGGAYAKGSSVGASSAGKLVAGASSGTHIRALEASAGADLMRAVQCNFVSLGVDVGGRTRTLRVVATTAQVNAGLTLLPAIPGVAYRIHDAAMIAIGGNASGATSVDIRGTQATSGVSLMASAVAGLTQNALLRAGAANGAILAGGASFAPCDANTAITVIKNGSDLATSTAVHVLLTYELVSA